MYKLNLAGTAVLMGCALTAHAQNSLIGDLGWPSWPSGEMPIDSLPYHGENGDMSGGFQVGDAVADFTVYDFEGNPLTLSDKLTGDKPVIILSGSVTCNRFRDIFNPEFVNADNLITRTFMNDNLNNFEWVFIYNAEAHPSEGWCPSNCWLGAQLDTTVLQHPDYDYRRFAMRDWMESVTHQFPFNMYADNPNNSVYDTFFRRPSGCVVLNCEGIVQMRGDWTQLFIPGNSDALLDLLDIPFQNCEEDNPIGLGGETAAMAELTIYPNPVADVLTLQASENGHAFLTDMTGRQVAQFRINKFIDAIDMGVLPSGPYFIHFIGDSGAITQLQISRL